MLCECTEAIASDPLVWFVGLVLGFSTAIAFVLEVTK
jgi:hypothetical protein